MDIERKIAGQIIDRALAAGYTVSVWDGEAYCLKRSTGKGAIMAAIGSSDGDSLLIREAGGRKVGSIALVWGNGEDIVCDYTDNPAIRALVGD